MKRLLYQSFACLALAALLVAAAAGIVDRRSANAAPIEVVNPSLEQVTGGQPDCFERSGWGNHTAQWSITADAHTGTKAQTLTMSNYVNGDRKLIMKENATCAPAVNAGQKYRLSLWYKSTSNKNSLTVFRHSAAGWTYWTDIKTFPASAVWDDVVVETPVVPAGTDQISFGLSLSENGTLTTDDYAIAQVGGPVPGPSGELTSNPGLEEGGSLPTGWMVAGWGDATLTKNVVTTGVHGGSRAYSITMANRTNGDYKLLPTEAESPTVEPGAVYNLSAWYKATTASNSVTIFAHTASGWGYWTDLQTLPAAAAWTKVTTQTPAIPAGVDAIAWGISLSANGTLVTDDYSTTKAGTTAPPPATGAAAVGQWSVLDYQMPIRSIHSTLLKNGKVLLIAGSGNSTENFAAGSFKASVWDPITGVFNTLDVPKDMFCAGHVTLGDGRVLIQGGTKSYPSTEGLADYGGLKDSWIFNPDDNTFTPTNDAIEGHWYPTLTQLGDGDVWMAGGLREDTAGTVITEHFDHETSTWRRGDQVQQTWSFWGLYPSMHLMADGRLFYSGTHTFGKGLSGTGASIYNHVTGAINDVPGLRGKDQRDQSASLLLPPAQDQKVMIAGGGDGHEATAALNLTDIIDLKEPLPAYQPGPNLPGAGKMYLNGTILPDRTVLVSNGGQLNRDNSANVMTAAVYNPATNAWASVAADPIGRNYHSSAVLLPDGRVAVFGSNPGDDTFEMRISVYQPNYFFRTARPQISNVPAQTTYGQQFNFNVNSGAKTVKWAQLTRPMSVTHQMDSNLRLVDLPVVVQNGIATVSIPANRNLLPPGPYMLTVTDSDNIPSSAAWVMVQ